MNKYDIQLCYITNTRSNMQADCLDIVIKVINENHLNKQSIRPINFTFVLVGLHN